MYSAGFEISQDGWQYRLVDSSQLILLNIYAVWSSAYKMLNQLCSLHNTCMLSPTLALVVSLLHAFCVSMFVSIFR